MSQPPGRPNEGPLPLGATAGSAKGALDSASGNAPASAAPASPARRWTAADGIHVDVRGLAPPEPFLAIVRLIESIGDVTTPVIVHHERDPVLLYGELAERGWTVERVDSDPGEVRLKLQHAQ